MNKMPDKYLLSRRYLCSRLPEGAYTTEPNVWVSQDKVQCRHIIGASCFCPEHRVDTCYVWQRAFEEFERANAQSQPKCTGIVEGFSPRTEISGFVEGFSSIPKLTRRIDTIELGYSADD
jgi:hypothetical protein